MPRILTSLFSPRLLRPLFWVLALFTFAMAVLPKPPKLPIDRFGDKFEHMLAFAVLTLAAELAWRGRGVWRIVLGFSLFGAAIEVVQAIPLLHRDSDVRDWIADSMAIALATLFAQLLLRILPSDEMD